jgi:uncharacterized protein (DUF486 family)
MSSSSARLWRAPAITPQPQKIDRPSRMKTILVPLMLLTAGLLMSFAWIGHLKFKSWNFFVALAASWFLVLPEYLLNVFSVRWGRDVFSGAQMAAMHLGSGVLFVTLIAKLYLGEGLRWSQYAGFALMGLAIVLILVKF